jgi:hypothetical protein
MMHCLGCAVSLRRQAATSSVPIVDLIFVVAARTVDVDFDAANGSDSVAGN